MTGSPESGLTSEQLEFLALAREHQHLYLEFEGDASKAARLVYETAIDADEPAGGTSIVAVGHEVSGFRLELLQGLLKAGLLARNVEADYDAECDGVSVRALAYRASPAGLAALIAHLIDAGEMGPVALRSHAALPLIDQPVFWSDLETVSPHVDSVVYFERGIHPRPHPLERLVDLLGPEHAFDPTVIKLAFTAEEAHHRISQALLAGQRVERGLARDYHLACEQLAAIVLSEYRDPSTHAVLRLHDPRTGDEAWFLLPLGAASRYQEYFEHLNRQAAKQGLIAA